MSLRLLGPAGSSATSAPSSSLIARALVMSCPRLAVSQAEEAASAGVRSPSSEGLGVALSRSGWVVDGGRAGVASGCGAHWVSVTSAFAMAALEALETWALAVALARAHAGPGMSNKETCPPCWWEDVEGEAERLLDSARANEQDSENSHVSQEQDDDRTVDRDETDPYNRVIFGRRRPDSVAMEWTSKTLYIERECCLLVLNLVSSTLSCIRQPRPRL